MISRIAISPLAPIPVVGVRKIAANHSGTGVATFYQADIVSVSVPIMSGYPFGMFPKTTNLRFGSFSNAALAVEIKERSWSVSSYRFGFNGQERDNEVSGVGNSYTAEYWQYDSRLGRRWNVDPVFKHYSSDYACFSNNSICRIDPNGDDDFFDKNGKFLGSIGSGSRILIIDDRRCFNVINSTKMSIDRKLNALNDHGVQDFGTYEFNKSNLHAASSILTYYYQQIYSTDKLHNGKISIETNTFKWNKETGKYERITYNDGVSGGTANTSFPNSQNYKITFSFRGVHEENAKSLVIEEFIENFHDLNVIIKHEEFHAKKHRHTDVEGGNKAIVAHLDAYYYSMTEGKGFELASKNFKHSYLKNVRNYLEQISDEKLKAQQTKRFEDFISEKK